MCCKSNEALRRSIYSYQRANIAAFFGCFSLENALQSSSWPGNGGNDDVGRKVTYVRNDEKHCKFMYFDNLVPFRNDHTKVTNTASRSLCEVKHLRAQLVLRWGTTLES